MINRNYAFALSAVAIWSTLACTAKLLLNSLPDFETLFLSGAFAGGFLLIFNIATGKLKDILATPAGDIGKMAAMGFIGVFVYSALYYRGIALLTSQEACIINYLWPVMILLFSCILLKEAFTAKKIIAMLCSFLGIAILSLGNGLDGLKANAEGILLCIAAAVCYGLYSVLNKKADLDQGVTQMVVWLVVMFGGLAMKPFTEPWVPLTLPAVLGMAWLGIVVDAVAYYLWALALNGEKNSAGIANLAFLTPFLSVLVSAMILHEKLQAAALIGLIFIVGGIAIQSIDFGKLQSRKH